MAKKKTKNIPDAAKKNTPSFSSRNSSYFPMIGALVFIIGLYQAITLRWVSDDAFITFRYVQNFVAGNGIVYNIGEYVEGYTHFLWLLTLSGAKFIGFDPVNASICFGIVAYASILILFIFISKKENEQGRAPRKKFYIPLAAALLALNYDMA